MKKNILILGANGFIGNALIERILDTTDWIIHGMDLYSDRLTPYLANPRLNFKQGDFTQEKDWVEKHIQLSDDVLPFAAVAIPSAYVKDPLGVFELDFVANLEVVRQCVQYNKRIIFPSTSEVYGMCQDEVFDEKTSNLILGPIEKERWIYACSKQMLDRVIFAYGHHEHLQFTLFRPFNWIGPNQDSIYDAKDGSSRVVTQFISNILHEKNIKLVNGGMQKRCFTDIEDGIDALMKIIINQDNCADKKIFNIGNPDNNLSIKEVAESILMQANDYDALREKAQRCQIMDVDGNEYYGKNYQDTNSRVPSIEKAKQSLNWTPTIDFSTSLKKILSFHFAGHPADAQAAHAGLAESEAL